MFPILRSSLFGRFSSVSGGMGSVSKKTFLFFGLYDNRAHIITGVLCSFVTL